MRALRFGAGLAPRFRSPPADTSEPEDVITEEAGIRAPWGQDIRVQLLVDEGATVAQGAPVARFSDDPDLNLVAPMPGRIARISLLPGHRLAEIILFLERDGDVTEFAVEQAGSATGLRALMKQAGVWSWLRRRPFGGVPPADESPAAIFVMATDTRPFAPDPRIALEGCEESFTRGLDALSRLTEGPIFVCQQPGTPLFDSGLSKGRVQVVECGPRHPQGMAGFRIHDRFPAEIDVPVWDILADDVAALGDLLATGTLSTVRHVAIAGEALRSSRFVRTQIGADMRALTHRIVTRGSHVLLSGSPLDGHPAHWLAPGHRQITVLPREEARNVSHWLLEALTRSAQPAPIIPSAALTHAFGAALPAAAFVRALASGDDETAIRLGILSLLEEDVALADYVLGGEAHLRELLSGMLDRIQREVAA